MAGRISMIRGGGIRLSGGPVAYLDPKRTSPDGMNFVSHAHSDHLPSGGGGTILASAETRMIASLRSCEMNDHTESAGGATLVDSGHILGSTGILTDGIFYTGDISVRSRGFLKGARVPKCNVLITECTFGLPEFVFPPVREIISTVNRIISDMYARGKPVILMGHKLGKAQMLAHLFGHWDPLYYSDDILEMNSLHRSLGVPLKDAPGHTEAERSGLLDRGPWVMIAPMMSQGSGFVKSMKSKYGAVTVGFNGWTKSSRFAFGRGCDISIPLSDHCDFNELVQLVIDSRAEKVYTVHGFVEEFAAYLRKMGFDAQPLAGGGLDEHL